MSKISADHITKSEMIVKAKKLNKKGSFVNKTLAEAQASQKRALSLKQVDKESLSLVVQL